MNRSMAIWSHAQPRSAAELVARLGRHHERFSYDDMA